MKQILSLLSLLLILGCSTTSGNGDDYKYKPIYISGNRMTYKFDIDVLEYVTAEAARRCSTAGKRMEIEGTPSCGGPYKLSGGLFTYQDCIGNFVCK